MKKSFNTKLKEYVESYNNNNKNSLNEIIKFKYKNISFKISVRSDRNGIFLQFLPKKPMTDDEKSSYGDILAKHINKKFKIDWAGYKYDSPAAGIDIFIPTPGIAEIIEKGLK